MYHFYQDALSLLQMRGAALVACDLIHLNPSWINSLLRELLDHNLADPTKVLFTSQFLMCDACSISHCTENAPK